MFLSGETKLLDIEGKSSVMSSPISYYNIYQILKLNLYEIFTVFIIFTNLNYKTGLHFSLIKYSMHKLQIMYMLYTWKLSWSYTKAKCLEDILKTLALDRDKTHSYTGTIIII